MGLVFYIEANNVAEAWLKTLNEIIENGDDIKTQYDKEGDPPSKDGTALVKINEPFSNPLKNERTKSKRIIKVRSKFGNEYEVYGHMGDYCLIPSIQSGYIEEVLDGLLDHNLTDSKESYPYSYHDRLFSYLPYGLEDIPFKEWDLHFADLSDFKNHQKLSNLVNVKSEDNLIVTRKNGEKLRVPDPNYSPGQKLPIELLNFPRINQIEIAITGLKKHPISRRIQAITWRPYTDPFRDDPPCLQRLWFRVKNNKLILQTSWRSRDLFKAWQSNVNAMIRIQKMIAEKLDLEIGEYVDFSNALHVYGKDIQDAIAVISKAKMT
ncbi:MAG: thymidylate synthase [Promethearchaeota archaeon]